MSRHDTPVEGHSAKPDCRRPPRSGRMLLVISRVLHLGILPPPVA